MLGVVDQTVDRASGSSEASVLFTFGKPSVSTAGQVHQDDRSRHDDHDERNRPYLRVGQLARRFLYSDKPVHDTMYRAINSRTPSVSTSSISKTHDSNRGRNWQARSAN